MRPKIWVIAVSNPVPFEHPKEGAITAAEPARVPNRTYYTKRLRAQELKEVSPEEARKLQAKAGKKAEAEAREAAEPQAKAEVKAEAKDKPDKASGGGK